MGPSGAGTFLSGSGAPTAGVGVDGAIYLDTASGRVWGPKAAGAWPGSAFGRIIPLAPDLGPAQDRLGGPMPTTTIYALRYPAPTDAADGPVGFQNLATDVESKLGGAAHQPPRLTGRWPDRPPQGDRGRAGLASSISAAYATSPVALIRSAGAGALSDR